MQNTLNQLTQQLKATKRAHRLFLSLVQDVAGGGGDALQEEINDLSTKFSQLLDTLNTFNKALEEAYHQSAEDDTELEDALAQFKKLKVKTSTHLNALSHATEGAQTLENANRLSKSLEDLEMLLEALQANHQSWFANTPPNPSQETPKTSQTESTPGDNTPQVKPLWKYGSNTLQAFQDYMKAKDLGSAGAWLELGKMAVEGIVLYPDNHVAMRCFEKAIELGSVQAMVELGKLYMENGDTQILEYGSGEVISGQEVINALKPLGDEIIYSLDEDKMNQMSQEALMEAFKKEGQISEDYLEIFKHCKVFQDKKVFNCHQKAKELFEKAVSLGEGRGYLELAALHVAEFQKRDNWFKDGDKWKATRREAGRICHQGLESLKTQAKQGDGEAYALWGFALYFYDNIEEGGEVCHQIVQLFKKSVELGYADGYYYWGDFASDLGQNREALTYFKKGAKLGSGKCALWLAQQGSKSLFYHLLHEGYDDLNDFRKMAEQAMAVMDELGEHIKLLEFVALTCRHYKILPELLIHLNTAQKISDQVGLGNVERYRDFLKNPYATIVQILMRSKPFERDLGSGYLFGNSLSRYGLWNLSLGGMRAFKRPGHDASSLLRCDYVESDGSIR
ncbi:sel1 repeat family protein [Helicobacter bizzozeronii]|uniref:sel1 repeat family protein n=1 Tax=Helicobacter bizzozeronii TaxID=56877 RepID=UPI0018F83303|nr:sel1 repeat family protein [Helicobacter bizzozeronii]